MKYAFACLIVDVISEYAFPQGYNYLDKPEFDSSYYESWIAFAKISHLLKHFGWLSPILDVMPMRITKLINLKAYVALKQLNELRQRTRALERRRDKDKCKELTAKPSMMEAFLNLDLPEYEKTLIKIAGEAKAAMAAGTLTSSYAPKHATYHILADPEIHERLMAELEEAIPNVDKPVTLRELESIHYLVAILYETLRNFHGLSHRLQRICPDQPILYREWSIPPGTPVSMTSAHVHDDPNIFPERWLPLKTRGSASAKVCNGVR